MDGRFSVHLVLVLDLLFEGLFEGVVLVDGGGSLDVGFLENSCSVGACQHLSGFCYGFAVFSFVCYIEGEGTFEFGV